MHVYMYICIETYVRHLRLCTQEKDNLYKHRYVVQGASEGASENAEYSSKARNHVPGPPSGTMTGRTF